MAFDVASFPMRATDAAFREAARRIGCTVQTMRAVFEVEASGQFFDADGPITRFEPHHFPKEHWPALGFRPRSGQAPWRRSLELSKSRRAKMFAIARDIDEEAALDATSVGAPQIMGFNAEAAGFASARKMYAAFDRSADAQVIAFADFVVHEGLDGYLRASDWYNFARHYNGPGRAAKYAARIESAFRRQTGGRASREVLRAGSHGASVSALQQRLTFAGYQLEQSGSFDAATRRAVRRFQEEEGLVVDGIVGARTWAALYAADDRRETQLEQEGLAPRSAPLPEPRNHMNGFEERFSTIAEKAAMPVAATTATGIFSSLSENAELILIGGSVLVAVIVAAAWAVPKLRGVT